MPVYRARAELRRLHRDAEWELGGVLVAERWFPAGPGIDSPTGRHVEAGLVRLVELPAFLAPYEAVAPTVALQEAMRLGYRASARPTRRGARLGPRVQRMTVDAP